MDILRSEDMELYELAVASHNARSVVAALARTEAVHVVPTGDPVNRPFVNELRRIEESLLKVQTLEAAVHLKKLILLGSERDVREMLKEDHDCGRIQAELADLFGYYSNLVKNLEDIKFKLESSQ
jgi:hypothetical protein